MTSILAPQIYRSNLTPTPPTAIAPHPSRLHVPVFVSWSTNDTPTATRLFRLLDSHSESRADYRFTFWNSKDDSIVGLPTDQYIHRLAEHQVVLHCVSPAWTKSKPVTQRELPLAAHKIEIPVGLIGTDLEIHQRQVFLWNARWFSNLRSSDQQNEFVKALVQAIARRLDLEGWK
ncbi:MAG: hypothetical protein FWD59_09525 [Micrococcales bacterium]|nr:hypothetical protein [Micrococcales bacterium]